MQPHLCMAGRFFMSAVALLLLLDTVPRVVSPGAPPLFRGSQLMWRL